MDQARRESREQMSIQKMIQRGLVVADKEESGLTPDISRTSTVNPRCSHRISRRLHLLSSCWHRAASARGEDRKTASGASLLWRKVRTAQCLATTPLQCRLIVVLICITFVHIQSGVKCLRPYGSALGFQLRYLCFSNGAPQVLRSSLLT